jgi:4-azaleucine resistance transporter AzlC
VLFRDSRRRLVADALGIAASAVAFGLVYGIAARTAGFSTLEAGSMSILVFAGSAQFAAVGAIQAGATWTSVVLVTALINARHLLYGAALAPYFWDRSRALRALMAHVLDDETFALSLAHFRRIGRPDLLGYWLAAALGTFVPWIGATLIGVTLADQIVDPTQFGLDIIYPAAMAGLTVGLINGGREIVAAGIGAIAGIAVGLWWDPSAGIMAGGIAGSIIGMGVPSSWWADVRSADGENHER